MSLARTWSLALASVTLVSLVSLVGIVTLALDAQRRRRLTLLMVSFAVGALLGDAFIHLVPETFAAARADGRPVLGPSLLILAGLLLFFAAEKLVRHHQDLSVGHGDPAPRSARPIARPELVAMNLLGDALHNFIDGALIAASYLASPGLGLATTVAVVLHEIPQELGDFGILVHSGLSVRAALLLNLASASVAILGTVAALITGAAIHGVAAALLPITAGGFVYLAAADLIPELQHDRRTPALFAQSLLIALGIATMGLLTLVD